LDDLVIARADGVPTYNLTVVVDDMDMGITHVIRGDDHINNTPRQINILNALQAKLPLYAHVPMILGADGSRMSKRHGAVGVMQYRDDGFLPEALLSYLVRLGWSHGDQEIFSMKELLELFKLEDVSKSASTFNPEKLLWVNQEFIKAMGPAELLENCQWHFDKSGIKIVDKAYAQSVIELIKERCKTLLDVVSMSEYFFNEVAEYDDAQVRKHVRPISIDLLKDLLKKLSLLEQWNSELIQQQIQAVVNQFEVGFGKVAQPVRIAVTGSTVSPSIDSTLELLGKEVTLRRLSNAVDAFERELQPRQ
jgi:glutamyl-tRNA synthetase